MDAHNKLYQPFIKHIPLLIVNQLMHKDMRQLFILQFADWQNDSRPKEANQHRGSNQRITRQFNSCFDIEFFFSARQQIQDFDIRHLLVSRFDVSDKALINRYLTDKQNQCQC